MRRYRKKGGNRVSTLNQWKLTLELQSHCPSIYFVNILSDFSTNELTQDNTGTAVREVMQYD